MFGRNRLQRAGDRRLFHRLSIIARVKSRERLPHSPRLFDDRAEVGAGALLAAPQPQYGGLKTIADQIILARALVLQILLGPATLYFVERRLRDIKMPAFDQLAHLAEEKRKQKRADMRPVDIRVGHDDDLVITQFVHIEVVAPDPGAERGDQGPDFLARQHLVEARPLDIEDFSAQRKHGLILPVAALLGGAARRIALDEK